MPPEKRRRRFFSVKQELLNKSREAALAAVQIFNNPNITFKSEIYIMLMHVAWTYLFHAYYRQSNIDYRYSEIVNVRRRFDRTKKGAYKHWELERCLNDEHSPLDKDTANNLRFLIGLRHEIEHQMTTRIDDLINARFQAACLNYNHYIKTLFGEEYAIDKDLSFSLQLSSLTEEQVEMLQDQKDLPPNIASFIEGFDGELDDNEYNNPRFAYRVLFVAKTANRKGQADRVIEFVKPGSDLSSQINAQYVLTREVEKKKYLPSQIVNIMRDKGFVAFNMPTHISLWKAKDAKNPDKGYGADVAGAWYWYDRWIEVVEDHCTKNKERYQ